jgi:hypothetical protein
LTVGNKIYLKISRIKLLISAVKINTKVHNKMQKSSSSETGGASTAARPRPIPLSPPGWIQHDADACLLHPHPYAEELLKDVTRKAS